MNKKPILYMQTDQRWKNNSYAVKGETSTIGSAGCGPTSAAMLIETITGKPFTPVDAVSWSLKNGYKALNQGTYYTYFAAQFKAHGLTCKQLNSANVYGKPTDQVHNTAFNHLKDGWYLITCMGKGTWTSSGHYIVVWWEDGKVRINDPASTSTARLNGDLATFKKEVKYYWAIDARNFNKVDKEEEEIVTQVEFNKMMDVYLDEQRAKPASSWATDEWNKVVKAGVFDGSAPQGDITREQVAALFNRLGLIK